MTSGVSSGREIVMKRVTGTTRAAGPPGRARGGADGGGLTDGWDVRWPSRCTPGSGIAGSGPRGRSRARDAAGRAGNCVTGGRSGGRASVREAAR